MPYSSNLNLICLAVIQANVMKSESSILHHVNAPFSELWNRHTVVAVKFTTTVLEPQRLDF